ncbi:unnamed protein product [Caenorhabditis brenneri]
MANPTTPEESKPKNDFKLELTPLKSVINPDVPLSMKLKNVTEKTQAVVVEVESYLFELKNPRATVEPWSQVYHKLEPGKTMSFKIRFVKKPIFESGQHYDNEGLNKNPEGWLNVYHTATSISEDTDLEWGFSEIDNDGRPVSPGRRVIQNGELKSYAGHVQMKLICEKETELTKKIRERIGKDYEEPKKKCSIM